MAICIIPARGGSRRIPRKNIRDFHGKPIIAYSIMAAQDSELFDRVIVSTDDPEIASVSGLYGAYLHQRSPERSVDEVGTQDVVKEVLENFKVSGMDLVCCLYPCSPFVTSSILIDAANSMWMGYVVSVYAHRIEDCGNFYMGRAMDFLSGEPLSSKKTVLFPLKDAIDINTEDDWKLAEEMYERINGDQRDGVVYG